MCYSVKYELSSSDPRNVKIVIGSLSSCCIGRLDLQSFKCEQISIYKKKSKEKKSFERASFYFLCKEMLPNQG